MPTASRSPGFVMAADAKKVNPNVMVSILRWEYPNWVKAKAAGSERYAAIYKWYKETIFDAYEKYGYVIDYIDPDKNETGSPDGEIIKYFANALKNETDFPATSPRKPRKPTTTSRSWPPTKIRA